MPSHKAVIAAALLAAIAGGVASLSFEPTITTKLAGTELGQRALGHLLAAKAPAPPAGLNIAERGGMKLHLADIALTRARLFNDKDALKKARVLIDECGYGRRLPELEDAEQRLRQAQ